MGVIAGPDGSIRDGNPYVHRTGLAGWAPNFVARQKMSLDMGSATSYLGCYFCAFLTSIVQRTLSPKAVGKHVVNEAAKLAAQPGSSS